MGSGSRPDDSSKLPEVASPSSLEVDVDTVEDVALLDSPRNFRGLASVEVLLIGCTVLPCILHA